MVPDTKTTTKKTTDSKDSDSKDSDKKAMLTVTSAFEKVFKDVFWEHSVCVKSCPTDKTGLKLECAPNAKDLCDKVKQPHATRSFMDVCVPYPNSLSTAEKKNWDMIVQGLRKNTIFNYFVYLISSWKAIVFSMVGSLVLSLLYIFFMSLFAEYVAWGLVFLIQVGLFIMGFGGIGYYYVKNYKKEAKEIENVNKGRAALAVGIIALLFALIFLCFVCIGMN